MPYPAYAVAMLSEPTQCARLVLVRHPGLAERYRSVALGRGEAELSRRGRQYTLTLMRSLTGVQVDRVFSPPVKHCQEVAEAFVRDRGLEVETDERLHDQALGEWEGHGWDDLGRRDEALVRDFFRDYGLVAPPSGETLADAVDRMLVWWNELVPSVDGKTVLLVAAAPILSGFTARLLGLSIRRAPALSLPAGAFGILDVYGDGAVIRTWHPLCLNEDVP